MMPPQLNFHQIIEKFFQPLNKSYRFLTISASVIIGLALYAGLDIGLAELARQNSYDMHMLSAELLNELGPEYTVDSNEHAVIIAKYGKHLEQRKLAAILQFVYPECSPAKGLAPALSGLEEVVKNNKPDKEAKEAIWQAGLASNRLYKRSERFPRSPYKWFKSEVVSKELSEDIDDAIAALHEEVDTLESAQTQKAAKDACRATCRKSRKAILLLFLARLSYDNKEKIECFMSDVRRAHECTLRLAEENAKDEVKKKLFDDRARNKKYRLRVLEAMFDDNDMDKVHEVLSEWIEFAVVWREAKKTLEEEKGNAAG